MNEKTAGDRLRYAEQFHSILTTGDAQPLLQLQPAKRIHAMKALASLSRFSGEYDVWLQIRQRYNLKWSTGNEALATFERFFDDKKTLDTMLQWVREAIRVLPSEDMRAVIKFNCLTGLRPNEAIQAIRLIKDPEQVKTYYNADRHVLEHFRFPAIFIRRTKAAYVSILNKEILGIAQNIEKKIPTYEALRFASTRRGLSFQMGYCRKIFASYLRQSAGIEGEIVDLLQGRVPKSVFARHYFTPSIEYRQKVLGAIQKLEQAI